MSAASINKQQHVTLILHKLYAGITHGNKYWYVHACIPQVEIVVSSCHVVALSHVTYDKLLPMRLDLDALPKRNYNKTDPYMLI